MVENEFDFPEKPKRKRKNDFTRPEKDYLPEAILTFLLYWAGWIVGFIVNLYLLNQAHQRRVNEGEIQSNLGCLRALLWLNLLPFIMAAFIIVVVILGQ